MAVSHQSGTILHHWNDPPATTFAKNKSASSSTVSLGLPTPPVTPSIETSDQLARDLERLLGIPSTLVGRNKDMIFTRVRGLIKSVEERRIPGSSPPSWRVLIVDSQRCALEEMVNDVQGGKKGVARERIVKLMSDEGGIAAWATALRMMIENLSL